MQQHTHPVMKNTVREQSGHNGRNRITLADADDGLVFTYDGTTSVERLLKT